MDVTFGRERFLDVAPHLPPLLVKHWDEVGEGGELSFNWAAYAEADASGSLVPMVMRADGALVGYAFFFLGPNNHQKNIIKAVSDIFYIEPPYRGHALKLINLSKAILRDSGAEKVYFVSKTGTRAATLLKSLKLTLVEEVYECPL
jgi:hypothetical protein